MRAAVRPSGTRLRAASAVSRMLPPSLVLAIVVLLSGIKAELGVLGVAALLAGVVVIPVVLYKGSKGFVRRRGLPDRWRVQLLAVLTFTSAVACFLIPVAEPVPLTVAALFAGNAGLVFFRRWLNVSAHVSVLTFAVLWMTAMFGTAWAWLLILTPLMIFSRVSLHQHTLREALAGAALGLATFACFLNATGLSWLVAFHSASGS